VDAQGRPTRDIAHIVQLASSDNTGRARAQIDDRPAPLRNDFTQLASEHVKGANGVAVVVHADVLARRPPQEPRLVEVVAQQPDVVTARLIDPRMGGPAVTSGDIRGDSRQLVYIYYLYLNDRVTIDRLQT